MKLLRLKVFPRGPNGWESESLSFAKEVTQLYGPNGCGKTPLIQSVVFCLGFPCQFREDIYLNCSHARLDFEIKGKAYVAERAFSKDFDIKLTSPGGDDQRFYGEKEYSAYLFEEIGIGFPNLVTNSDKVTTPFISSILPIFYLDQDEGYGGFYCPPSSFVKDQFSEMVRLVLDLPIKNSFEKKKSKLDAKRYLDHLDQQVYIKRKELEIAEEGSSERLRDNDGIDKELAALKKSLDNLRESGSTKSASIEAIDEIISGNITFLRKLQRDIDEIERRNKSVHQIIGEINAEINTLNLNEESKRVFQSFNEICSADGCQMFSFSSDSYGKNLLYLKDQIKDLERSTTNSGSKLAELIRQASEIQKQTNFLVEKKRSLLSENEIGSLVEAITQLTKSIFNLELEKRELEQVEELKKRFVELLNARDEALDIYGSFSSEVTSNPRIVKIRSDLRDSFLRWLDILDTNNISSDISFRDDFIPVLGTENISQLKGSTRIRVVLAYHAALMEVFNSAGRGIFKFIILDTPKQHEMHEVDLSRYLSALKISARKYQFQVVFSATEFRHVGDDDDSEWSPKFPGKKQNMFLEM